MRSGDLRRAVACGVVCGALLLLPRGAWPEETTPPGGLVITNTRVLPVSVAREAAGPLPRERASWDRWARDAVKRIVAVYHERGYEYARAWFGPTSDEGLRIHVDEGQTRILFTGAGSISAFLYQVDLNLPHNVFHGPTLRHALDELKTKHGLLNVYYRVKEPGEIKTTPFGKPVPQRVLQIYIVRREVFGWGFDISLSSTWGVLPALSFSHKGLLWGDDRFNAELEVAFPFRRYLFDKDPKATWVHGGIEASYRLPRWLDRRLGLRPRTSLRASRYERVDIGLVSFYQLRSVTVAELVGYLGVLEVGIGAGVDANWILDVQQLQQTAGVPPPPSETSAVRSLWRSFIRLHPDSEVLRRDQRSYLDTRLDVLTERFDDHMLDLDIRGQLFVILGRHRLIGRLRGTVLGGQVPFWDDVQLAGDYQRVFFGDRYWVHEAAQIEVAYRVNLFWDWFEAGLFHDLSVFVDRSRVENPVAVADAFGPSLHFLVLDTFALGLYSGFGFSPAGFDHTFSFNVQTIF